MSQPLEPATSLVPDPDNRPEVVSNRCLCDWDIRSLPNRVSKVVPDCPLHGELAEATSATLRRVEQERDEAVANFKRLQVLAREDFEKCTAVIKQTGDDRDKALSAFHLAEELRLKATAELASARTELDALRRALGES